MLNLRKIFAIFTKRRKNEFEFRLSIYTKRKIDELSEEDREKIMKMLKKCEKLESKCFEGFKCWGWKLYNDNVVWVRIENLKYALRCIKKDIKDIKHIVDFYKFRIELEHNFKFNCCEKLCELERRLAEVLRSEGLNCLSVSIFPSSCCIYLRFDELNEREIAKAIDKVKKLDFETIALSEVI